MKDLQPPRRVTRFRDCRIPCREMMIRGHQNDVSEASKTPHQPNQIENSNVEKDSERPSCFGKTRSYSDTCAGVGAPSQRVISETKVPSDRSLSRVCTGISWPSDFRK